MNTKKLGAKIIRLAAKDIGNLQPNPGKILNVWKTILPTLVLAGVFTLALNKVEIPKFGAKSSKNNLQQYIQDNPLDVSPSAIPIEKSKQIQAERPLLPPQKDPSSPSILEPTEPNVMASIPESKSSLLEISEGDKLVTYLSSLSLSESRAEAIKWVLDRWGVVSGNLKGSSEWLLDDIENDYQLIPYELSGNIKRLTQLNYPAILEITLPSSLGTKYLALLSVKSGIGSFGSVDRIEMPMDIIGKLWNRKAIVLWRDFESLPLALAKGFKGKEAIWIQKNLRLLGFFKGKESPNYGPKTQRAVTQFQRKHGIKDDGSFNSETRMTVYRLLNIYPTPTLTDG